MVTAVETVIQLKEQNYVILVFINQPKFTVKFKKVFLRDIWQQLLMAAS